jgi:hypothetical protein
MWGPFPPSPTPLRKLGTPTPHNTSTYGNNGSPKNLLFHFFGRKKKDCRFRFFHVHNKVYVVSCTTTDTHTHSLPMPDDFVKGPEWPGMVKLFLKIKISAHYEQVSGILANALR